MGIASDHSLVVQFVAHQGTTGQPDASSTGISMRVNPFTTQERSCNGRREVEEYYTRREPYHHRKLKMPCIPNVPGKGDFF